MEAGQCQESREVRDSEKSFHGVSQARNLKHADVTSLWRGLD
ncbi:hypothetical protein Syncc8109_2328 [Synechococcus sp. WH 8109]|nr:hypothetical protein Syncc8109_2328 [Synechococcus sp. WH 8109]